MAVTQIGLNLTSLQSLPALNLSIDNILSNAPSVANSITNHYLALGIAVVLLVCFYFVLSDKTPLGDFGYDDARALGIALGCVGILLTTLMEINYITSYKTLGIIVIAFLLTVIYITSYEERG